MKNILIFVQQKRNTHSLKKIKTMASANLFSKAKKAAPVKATSTKDSKVRIRIEDGKETFFENVSKLSQLQDNMKRDKAKADILADELKELGKDEWIKLYEKNGKNPESVMIEAVNDADDTAQFMFVPTDRYITINADRAEELQETYGVDIVEEKTTFSFDSDMVEKYGEVLSRMIEESTEISEKDKEKIIKATTTYSVAKGTIDNYTKFDDASVAEMVEATRPVVALKNVEVIKG